MRTRWTYAVLGLMIVIGGLFGPQSGVNAARASEPAADIQANDALRGSRGYTLRYRRAGETDTVNDFVVEISPQGHVRAGNSRDGVLIRDGVAYIVNSHLAGRLEDMRAVLVQCLDARAGSADQATVARYAAMTLDVVARGRRTIAGYSGLSYVIRGTGAPDDRAEIVVTTDPRLDVVRQYVSRAFIADHVAGNLIVLSPMADMVRRPSEVLSRGTPISVFGRRLISVTDGPIPAARFEFPTPVLSRAEIQRHAPEFNRLCER